MQISVTGTGSPQDIHVLADPFPSKNVGLKVAP